MSTIRAVARQNANESSYDASRFNAVKHGILSKLTVLPWENQDEYDALHAAFVEEHRPVGPTEEHLVEELAAIFWRKRRLRLAEWAIVHRQLENTTKSYRATAKAAQIHISSSADQDEIARAILSASEETARELDELDRMIGRTQKALLIAQSGKGDSYEKALKALPTDSREWWEDTLKEWAEEPVADRQDTSDTDSLAEWLEEQALHYFRDERLELVNLHDQRLELVNRAGIRTQTFGDAYDPGWLDNLARYETHLDRKLERTLAMLVKLQELRRQREIYDLATGESQ